MDTFNTVAFVAFCCVCAALCFETIQRWIYIELSNNKHKKTICIDFDGVLHNNIEPWTNARVINGDALPGTITWLNMLIHSLPKDYNIAIYSCRNPAFRGVHAIKKWLFLYGMSEENIAKLSFPIYKIPAHVTIDDRVLQFGGKYPDIQTILTFKPWNKRS